MPQSTSSVRTTDDQLVVEAPTAEAALELVAERLGTRARIAGVERVRRGGVGGFFARELVQVTATGEETMDGDDRSAAGPEGENAVDTLLRRIAARDDPFATALQRQFGDHPPDGDGAMAGDRLTAGDGAAAGDRPPDGDVGDDTPAERDAAPSAAASRPATLLHTPPSHTLPSHTPPPAHAPPAQHAPAALLPAVSAAPAAPLPGTPRWGIDNLCRLGLPPLLSVDDTARLAPTDDIGWTHAVAARLQPLCAPLPVGPTIIVGPAAERLAGPLDLAVHWPGQPTPPESFVTPISGRHSERDWLAAVRAGRHLHLVVGGPGWRGLLFDEPAVLSHTEASMCEAVSLAFQLGVGLGYTCHASGELVRTNPLDLAVAIRRLLPTYP